mmetsp:Transcript_17616/g.53298  ORF Transcript_17616/g.53298 Transcript_17616/m.53298 type:complete len:222 (+) Transcript_17616:1958-2623(+)|eukprot:scaffold169819_cov32-Tisochrysis_lutea.AAC.3
MGASVRLTAPRGSNATGIGSGSDGMAVGSGNDERTLGGEASFAFIRYNAFLCNPHRCCRPTVSVSTARRGPGALCIGCNCADDMLAPATLPSTDGGNAPALSKSTWSVFSSEAELRRLYSRSPAEHLSASCSPPSGTLMLSQASLACVAATSASSGGASSAEAAPAHSLSISSSTSSPASTQSSAISALVRAFSSFERSDARMHCSRRSASSTRLSRAKRC